MNCLQTLNQRDENLQHLKSQIETTNNFPQKGVIFQDVLSFFRSPHALEEVYDLWEMMVESYLGCHTKEGPTYIVAIEARGFPFASILAQRWQLPLALLRKPHKLPGLVHQVSYTLEYGSDSLCLQQSINLKDHRVIVIDDILATGGSLQAAFQLVEKAGGSCFGGLVIGHIKACDDLQKKREFKYPIFSIFEL